MDFFNIKIACPQDFGTVRTSQLRAKHLDNGIWVYSPFNGCEFSNGMPDCQYCQEKLRSFFMQQHDILEYGVIYDPLKL